jgi:hypothetical protein
MLDQLILATILVMAIVIIHLCGLAILTRLLRSHSRVLRSVRIMPLTLLAGATIGIIAIHTIEIWLYAAAYLGVGAFRRFEDALYFSTSTYAAIGYGDMLLPPKWRVFGVIEGPVGVIMLGLSTAYLVSLLARMKLLSHDWLTITESGSRD